MLHMDHNAGFVSAAGIQELNSGEVDKVGGGLFFVPALVFVGKAAAAGVVGLAAAGFVDGMIKGFQDDE